jgi:membrane-associated phospholipid phosphatase
MTRTIMAFPLAAGLLLAPTIVKADVVSDWNGIMVTTVSGQNAFAQARFSAITQLAVFEAVNAITGGYHPYLGTTVAPPGASPEAAAVTAAHAVLKHYFPGSGASLDMARASSLAAIPDGQPKTDGMAVGAAAAAAMIALRASDGSASPAPYTPLSGPGFWQPTPPLFGPGIQLHLGTVTPFGILSGDQFRSEPPPALTSARYRKDHNEVKTVGDVSSVARPGDRTDVARFFAATSAVQAWNWAAAQANGAYTATLLENARTLALLNMAINDGLVSSMETKYYYQFWRPVTAIRAGDTDGNKRTDPDPVYTPFVATPPFPSYPSAHASASYAARAVLERVYGPEGHLITLFNPAVPGMVLHYTSFGGITADIDDARVYGGIHFRFDQEAGARQGRQVGRFVFRHMLRGDSRQP